MPSTMYIHAQYLHHVHAQYLHHVHAVGACDFILKLNERWVSVGSEDGTIGLSSSQGAEPL